MEKIPHETLSVFRLEDFGVSPAYDRFSIHKGVLVIWDEDTDTRVLEFVDNMAKKRLPLAAVQEREGMLSLLWSGPIPAGFEEGKSVEMTGDLWDIAASVSLD